MPLETLARRLDEIDRYNQVQGWIIRIGLVVVLFIGGIAGYAIISGQQIEARDTQAIQSLVTRICEQSISNGLTAKFRQDVRNFFAATSSPQRQIAIEALAQPEPKVDYKQCGHLTLQDVPVYIPNPPATSTPSLGTVPTPPIGQSTPNGSQSQVNPGGATTLPRPVTRPTPAPSSTTTTTHSRPPPSSTTTTVCRHVVDGICQPTIP